MKNYQGYLIDLDGTMYHGNKVIEEAPLFVKRLNDKGIPYLFLTNNSTKTQKDVSDKLNNMGIPCTVDHVFTSSMATAKYIKEQNTNGRCYVIGEEGLLQSLKNEGLTIVKENSEFVVIGMDRQINYEKLANACLEVRNGATFISTNGDIAIPTERGLLPGNGSLTSVITVSTGQVPTFIGKPESIIMDQALKALGTKKEETLMVGDNYNTDIKAGIQAGLDTLMVFTGVTPFGEYSSLEVKPTYYVHNLSEVNI
ncbi:TIGR01457 family HAD-type hydrolase [Ornithinibacillus halophilus]|uniref:4-nitrophenyl phosphatase n=1 Tax=Ornithinibacillus halophilus TaxID=930117 RepID=A0A1M5JNY6_9BACI|nr:TIGR01457 family HAD-type hydrolase [Ornithinibacillus halophilus]SHG42287.1 4-nitrophenyl phosphatase [Ornithinibacillus halophilus]